MNYLVILSILCTGTLAAAQDEFLYYKDDKYHSVRVERIEGNQYINCKNKKCDALNFLNGKSVVRKPNATPEAGHPAAQYCWDAGAENRILKANTPDHDQSDYCLFKDGSMVDSWDLYLKHYPVIKKFGR